MDRRRISRTLAIVLGGAILADASPPWDAPPVAKPVTARQIAEAENLTWLRVVCATYVPDDQEGDGASQLSIDARRATRICREVQGDGTARPAI